MRFCDLLNSLTDEDREKLAAGLKSVNLDIDTIESLFTLKIALEGTNFHGTVPADMAHSLWKLQVAYYRMVGQVLYGSPSATLSTEEKETYKLVFKIEQGSTNSFATIDPSFLELATKVLGTMEPWQILLAVAMLCAAYLGSKWFSYLTDKKKIEADLSKELSSNEVTKKMLETHKDIFAAAHEAGREGRISILKGTSGISRASIGMREYDQNHIEEIRRRAARVKAVSNTVHLCLTVDELDAHDKENPTIVVHDKDSPLAFRATLALNPDDYSDFDKVLDMVWDSARFPERYFWAEVSFTKRREKILSASISAVALTEEDLPQTSEDLSE